MLRWGAGYLFGGSSSLGGLIICFVFLSRLGCTFTQRLTTLLRGGLRLFLFKSVVDLSCAVLFDQFVEGVQVTEHVDTSTTIQMRRLQNPQIIGVKVALGHRQSCVLFFVEIKCSKFGAIFIIFCLFLLLEHLYSFQFLDR